MRALLSILIVLSVLPVPAIAAGNIIQITRALRMASAESLPPKDFYLDLGMRDGLREGDIVEVYRLLPVTNVYAGAPFQLIKVVLGELKVLTVGEATSIGRMHRSRNAAELPAMESAGFMLGDQVQFSSKSNLPFR